MQNLKVIFFICLTGFMLCCQEEDPIETGVPGNDQVSYMIFELQKIDSAWYWGDSEKIRLQSAVIMLNPGNHTFFRRFYGTADESIDPSQAKWSKEGSGTFIFSADSSMVFFSNDADQLYYYPGFYDNGIYHQPRLEQYDSVWYSISYYSMAVSGRYIYTLRN